MMTMNKPFLMAEETGGETGSAAATAPATTASLLAQGDTAPAGNDWVPEKYRVTKTDGTFDLEASARKVADAHKHLEQRMGSGDAPPKTAEDYEPKIEVEGFKWDEFKTDPDSQSFLKSAHAKGITNDQLSFVLGEYYKRAPDLVSGSKTLDAEAAKTELRSEWKTDEELNQNLGHAFKAFTAFASEADRGRMNEVGNNPVVIRLLAKIGKEMREDSPVSGQSHAPAADFEVRASELRNKMQSIPSHDPARKQLQAELDSLYERKYGNKPQRLGGGANISTAR
jgi:hypothetical protein